jgi:hypothetical protein
VLRLKARESGYQNRDNPAELVLLKMKLEKPDFLKYASIVGAWVWVAFPDKPTRDTCDWLVSQGFHYNAKRKIWQHRGGRPSMHSPSDPRSKYGEIPAEDMLAA